MSPRKPVQESPRPSPGPGTPAQTLLVADDDRAVLSQIQRGLDGHGYRFVEAADGSEVLTALRVERPDLLLMDVEMPGLGGVEVCRIVKANQGHGFGFLPVILMTARRTHSKVEGLELGADDYLIKPFDMLELSARVKSMLRLKSLQDALLEKNRELDRANRELEERRRELLQLSRTDGLTGLANRRHFDERLVTEFSRAQRYRAPLACLMLDLDHFKRVNDQWGHGFGDVVLRQVAEVARRAVRDVDLVARYGGEELVALLPETGLAEAVLVGERVRAGVEGLRLSARGDGRATSVHCTASVGVAAFPGPGIDSAAGLVAAADACLYSAKEGGRNRVVHVEEGSP